MKKISLLVWVVGAFVGGLLFVGSVSAQQNNGLNPAPSNFASSSARITSKNIVKLNQAIVTLQTRASKEIDRRTTALNKLLDKIQSMKKISASDVSSFVTTIQGQINLLKDLKIKINADKDETTLKTDVQSVTKAYRIYALVLPQMEIIAGADRLASTTDLLSDYATKLQTRMTTVENGGQNVDALQKLLVDMNAKIADANAQSADAVIGVVGLKPDNGDKTVMTSNTAALKAARNDVKTGTQDLKNANQDGSKIRVGLQVFEKVSTTTATTTATGTSTSTSSTISQ